MNYRVEDVREFVDEKLIVNGKLNGQRLSEKYFVFLRNSPPNYFYFKGGDTARLKSKNQFQKHKLKNTLDLFDEKLSETENMYLNGFRKIYDCGNKV